VLIVAHEIDELASRFGRSAEAIEQSLAASRAALFKARAKRPRPHLDDKTITAWNGLMISGFARAYQVLGDAEYLAAAERAAAFIRANLYDEDAGKLIRRYRDGHAAIDGYVDDYAYFIQALLDLYEASFDVDHLTWAVALQEKQDALFWDDSGGGYFNTSGTDASILVRIKDDYDGAEPSANSVSLMNLFRLARMTDNKALDERAHQQLTAFSGRMSRAPHGMPQMLVAFDFHLDVPRQIIIAGKPGAADTVAMLRALHSRYIPNKVILLADGAGGQQTLAGYSEFIGSVKMMGGKATAYVCENFVCQLPTTDPETMLEQLGAADRCEPPARSAGGWFKPTLPPSH